MSPKTVPIEIKIGDRAEVKAALDQAAARIGELSTDRADLVKFVERCANEDWRGPKPWYIDAARTVLNRIGESV